MGDEMPADFAKYLAEANRLMNRPGNVEPKDARALAAFVLRSYRNNYRDALRHCEAARAQHQPGSPEWNRWLAVRAAVSRMKRDEALIATDLVRVLMNRDGLTTREACDRVADARDRVEAGENPEEILRDEFGVEPDFIFDLI